MPCASATLGVTGWLLDAPCVRCWCALGHRSIRRCIARGGLDGGRSVVLTHSHWNWVWAPGLQEQGQPSAAVRADGHTCPGIQIRGTSHPRNKNTKQKTMGCVSSQPSNGHYSLWIYRVRRLALSFTLVESGSRILSFVGDRCHQTFDAEEARDEGEKLLLLGGVG